MCAHLVDRFLARHAQRHDDATAVFFNELLDGHRQSLKPGTVPADGREAGAVAGALLQRIERFPAHVVTGEHGVNHADCVHTSFSRTERLVRAVNRPPTKARPTRPFPLRCPSVRSRVCCLSRELTVARGGTPSGPVSAVITLKDRASSRKSGINIAGALYCAAPRSAVSSACSDAQAASMSELGWRRQVQGAGSQHGGARVRQFVRATGLCLAILPN